MNISFAVSQDQSGSLVFLNCTPELMTRLGRILRDAYPHARPQIIPAPGHTQYSHCFRVPESEDAFRARWPQLQMRLLLAASTPPPIKPPRPARPVQQIVRQAETAPAPPPVEQEPAAPVPAPPDPRPALFDALLQAGDNAAVIEQISPEEQSPAVRARLGTALAREGRTQEARSHLLAAWEGQERPADAVLELARLHWRAGDYDHAAQAYLLLLDRHSVELAHGDFAALAELAAGGELSELDAANQLTLIETFLTEVGENDPRSDMLALRGLELARQTGNTQRVFHAYQHLLDVHIARRSGHAVQELIEQTAHDYWCRLLTGRDRFDLLDEVSEYLPDYPLLRHNLVAGYQELLRDAIDQARRQDGRFPDHARDVFRSLRRLERRCEAIDEYVRVRKEASSGGDQTGAGESEGDAAALGRLAGRRIALVGGHERTREHVREWLEQHGARVDEVAPPNNGRIGERDVQDKVQLSNLVLLIVGYMGHDMSKVVSNLQRRSALAGEVLPVDCRGTSGICRAILEWAARAQ